MLELYHSIDMHAKETRFYSIDPRAKIVAVALYIVAASLLRGAVPLSAALLCALILLAVSRIPAIHASKLYLQALPFIAVASLAAYFTRDASVFLSMFLRISVCILSLILLTGTTDFLDVLRGLRSFRIPRLLTDMLLFTYRYIFVFAEESERMAIARKARAFGGGRHLLDKRGMQTLSFTAGMLLVRAHERGKRIYDALLCRGYDGQIRTLTKMQFKAADAAFFSCMALLSVLLVYSDISLGVSIRIL